MHCFCWRSGPFLFSQVEEQRIARVAATNERIGALILPIVQMPNGPDKIAAAAAMEKIFPNNLVITEIVKSNQAITVASNVIKNQNPPHGNEKNALSNGELKKGDGKNKDSSGLTLQWLVGCDAAVGDLRALEDSKRALQGQLNDEIVGISGKRRGFGPLARAIQNQIDNVEEQISVLISFRHSWSCDT